MEDGTEVVVVNFIDKRREYWRSCYELRLYEKRVTIELVVTSSIGRRAPMELVVTLSVENS
jgi:hypothetical protein